MPEKITSNSHGGRTYSFNEMSSGNEFVSRIKRQFEQIASQQMESKNASHSRTHKEYKKHEFPIQRTLLDESLTSMSMKSPSSSTDSEPTTPGLNDNTYPNSEMEMLAQLNLETRPTVKEIITNFEEITSQLSKGNSNNQRSAKLTFHVSRQQKSPSSKLDLSFEENSQRTPSPAAVPRANTDSRSNKNQYYRIEVSQQKEVHRMVEKVKALEIKVDDLEKLVESLQETIVNLIKTDNNDDVIKGDTSPPIATLTMESLPALVSDDNSF